jgi:hypothetical protein
VSQVAEPARAVMQVSPELRVRRAALAVPLAALAAGGVSSAVDLRVGFLASAVVIGWTQLVGL